MRKIGKSEERLEKPRKAQKPSTKWLQGNNTWKTGGGDRQVFACPLPQSAGISQRSQLVKTML